MSSDPRDILRLKHCPQCGYDLAALPRTHRCPECGFDYDDSMFLIPTYGGWEPLSFRPALLLLIGLLGTFTVWAWKDGAIILAGMLSSIGALLLTAVALTYRESHRMQRLRRSSLAFFVTSGGISRQTRGKTGRECRWAQFDYIRVGRVREGVWRLHLGQRLWPLRIHSASLSGYVGCTRREAALLRNEIRRRIQAARAVKERARPKRS